jgi:hypothetical protein
MPKQVQVWVIWKNGQVVFEDKELGGGPAETVRLRKGDGDRVTWCSKSGSLKLSWPKGHPFETNPPDTLNHPGCIAPYVRVDPNIEGEFKYDVVLTVGSTPHEVDPRILIDSGFTPGAILTAILLAVGAMTGFWFAWRRFKRKAEH